MPCSLAVFAETVHGVLFDLLRLVPVSHNRVSQRQAFFRGGGQLFLLLVPIHSWDDGVAVKDDF